MRLLGALVLVPGLAGAAEVDGATVYLEEADGTRIEVATLAGPRNSYSVALNDAVFSDHFLSMRPFRCIEGAEKIWCHVPYPYDIKRDISDDLIDLEYDFLFVWKGKTDYGINMWNGVYYRLETVGEGLVGRMYEMDMGVLAVPPEAGELRPVREVDLEEADPEGHWLPRMVIR
ncbi:hypothetical protein [uncultured Roseobacter sp.]|uniref:hypothetical protein n=1 Tax=uncultured Roseobacter sp. TaxID=114847 RepID=UPI002623BC56|nr:hypothetical protein [uncultured Roseobacter sp.]